MIIGLCGYAQTGKDTSGIHLIDSYKFKRFAFADPLKEAATVLGWSGKKDEEGRRFLQLLGTEAIKNVFGEDFWARLIFKRINESDEKNVVITDIRFNIEADIVREHGGIVWRVHRPGFGPANNHRSELEVDEIVPDAVLNNDSTIEDLYKKIDDLLPVEPCVKGHKGRYASGRCIQCAKDYYQARKNRLLEYQKEYNSRHLSKIKRYNREYYLKYKEEHGK